jgi:hypothetical protein
MLESPPHSIAKHIPRPDIGVLMASLPEIPPEELIQTVENQPSLPKRLDWDDPKQRPMYIQDPESDLKIVLFRNNERADRAEDRALHRMFGPVYVPPADKSMYGFNEGEYYGTLTYGDKPHEKFIAVEQLRPLAPSHGLLLPAPEQTVNGQTISYTEKLQDWRNVTIDELQFLEKLSREQHAICWRVGSTPSMNRAHYHFMKDTIDAKYLDDRDEDATFPIVDWIKEGKYDPKGYFVLNKSKNYPFGEMRMPCRMFEDAQQALDAAKIFDAAGCKVDWVCVDGKHVLIIYYPLMESVYYTMTSPIICTPSVQRMGFMVVRNDFNISDKVHSRLYRMYYSMLSAMLPAEEAEELLAA